MRTGAGATVGVVTKLVNVHASLSIGVVAGNVPGDGGWAGFGGLLKGHCASDLGVSSEDGNCDQTRTRENVSFSEDQKKLLTKQGAEWTGSRHSSSNDSERARVQSRDGGVHVVLCLPALTILTCVFEFGSFLKFEMLKSGKVVMD